MIDGWLIERDDGRVYSYMGWVTERHSASTFSFEFEVIEAVREHLADASPMFSQDHVYKPSRVIIDDMGRVLSADEVKAMGIV